MCHQDSNHDKFNLLIQLNQVQEALQDDL
jgi:hypothetical protein